MKSASTEPVAANATCPPTRRLDPTSVRATPALIASRRQAARIRRR